MVRSLIVLHLAKEGWNGRPIDEPNVPIFVLVNARPKIAGSSHFVDDFILGVTYVYNELGLIGLLYLCQVGSLLLYRRGRVCFSLTGRFFFID